MILNLHGLYGTAENTNYRILTELYPISEIHSPQINFEKRSPYNIIERLYNIKDIDFIVGNSFGGFYAYAMGAKLNISCLLTNPCIPPAKYIRELIPEYPEKSLYQLRELTESADTKRLHETSCSTFVILGKDDDILDSKFTKNYIRNAEIHEIDGKHRLSGETYRKLFKELIHRIKDFPCELELKPSKGVFWDLDGLLLAFPYMENHFNSGLAKSEDTYAHKKLWLEIKPKKCNKPYNYYPRGRIEINSKGKAILYMNSNVDECLIPEIMIQFGLKEYPKIIYDNSNHYKCHLDDGWKTDR